MLIKVTLLKKESTQIIGGVKEYEEAALRLDYLVSCGHHDKWDDHCEVLFKGFQSPFTVKEPFDTFVERSTHLAKEFGIGKGFVNND
jgi:hypothetical protein